MDISDEEEVTVARLLALLVQRINTLVRKPGESGVTQLHTA